MTTIASVQHRAQEHRSNCERDRRTRWWKEGLVCAVVGAGFGVFVAVRAGWEPWLCAACFGLGVGALAAVFGPRVMYFVWN